MDNSHLTPLTTAPARRNILVTSALPYANGAIHLGHLVEYIQTDMWTRFQRLRGHKVWYVCADDTHGTPVMLRAEQEGITPEALIHRVHAEHQRDFSAFHIAFDHYGSTHSETTRLHAEAIYQRLQAAGLIESHEVEQFYDPVRMMFLPDRYVRGNCPRCDSSDQYGDSCEKCGAAYTPTELKNPKSALSGATPELRRSKHYFFRLSQCSEILQRFVATPGRLQTEAANKLQEWLTGVGDKALQDWDISRDAPYFGFKIPGTSDKYFYVWLDAPIGYFGSLQELATARGFSIDEFIAADATSEMYHFIGKDILYFHGLFWPAILHHSGHRLPSGIFAHGFLTVNGQKMSKSRGTFLNATDYLRHLNPEYLRYYYATKLSTGLEDIDLNLEDFVQRINSDLIGKYINIAARSAGFLHKQFDNRLHAQSGARLAADLPALLTQAEDIATAYEKREFGRAMRLIIALADKVNQFTDQHKPWELARTDALHEELHEVCSVLIQAFRLLTLYLKPVLPETARRVEEFLACEPLDWGMATALPPHHMIRPYSHLLTRLDPKAVEKMMNYSITPSPTPMPDTPTQTPAHITSEEFARVDLRVAQILSAEEVAGADRLLKLRLDFGGEDHRTVFAGIRSHYRPDQLVGQLTIAVANLAPRKMKFGISEGMVLAASSEITPGLFLLSPHAGATPGMKVK